MGLTDMGETGRHMSMGIIKKLDEDGWEYIVEDEDENINFQKLHKLSSVYNQEEVKLTVYEDTQEAGMSLQGCIDEMFRQENNQLAEKNKNLRPEVGVHGHW